MITTVPHTFLTPLRCSLLSAISLAKTSPAPIPDTWIASRLADEPVECISNCNLNPVGNICICFIKGSRSALAYDVRRGSTATNRCSKQQSSTVLGIPFALPCRQNPFALPVLTRKLAPEVSRQRECHRADDHLGSGEGPPPIVDKCRFRPMDDAFRRQ